MSQRGIPCPECGERDNGVTRTIKKFQSIKRERTCEKCGALFVTTEQIATSSKSQLPLLSAPIDLNVSPPLTINTTGTP